MIVVTLSLAGFALFAVGVALGDWRRGRQDRASVAVVREIREQSDRVIVVVLSAEATRTAAREEARKRAVLYPSPVPDAPPRDSLPRDTLES